MVSEPTSIAQTELVTSRNTSQAERLKSGPERRKRKRGMFSVPVQIRGGVGTLDVFEDLVTGLDVSRDDLLAPSIARAATLLASCALPSSCSRAFPRLRPLQKKEPRPFRDEVR